MIKGLQPPLPDPVLRHFHGIPRTARSPKPVSFAAWGVRVENELTAYVDREADKGLLNLR